MTSIEKYAKLRHRSKRDLDENQRIELRRPKSQDPKPSDISRLPTLNRKIQKERNFRVFEKFNGNIGLRIYQPELQGLDLLDQLPRNRKGNLAKEQ